MDTMQTTFATADIVLAAWLMAHGSALVGTDAADPQRVKFIIRPQPTADELAEFSAGDALCPVHSFYSAFRKCKAAIYNGGV